MKFISQLSQTIQGTGAEIRKKNTMFLYWVWKEDEGNLCPFHPAFLAHSGTVAQWPAWQPTHLPRAPCFSWVGGPSLTSLHIALTIVPPYHIPLFPFLCKIIIQNHLTFGYFFTCSPLLESKLHDEQEPDLTLQLSPCHLPMVPWKQQVHNSYLVKEVIISDVSILFKQVLSGQVVEARADLQTQADLRVWVTRGPMQGSHLDSDIGVRSSQETAMWVTLH